MGIDDTDDEEDDVDSAAASSGRRYPSADSSPTPIRDAPPSERTAGSDTAHWEGGGGVLKSVMEGDGRAWEKDGDVDGEVGAEEEVDADTEADWMG